MRPSASKRKNPDRFAAEGWGRRSETLAAWYLRAKFYRIRATRYKTPVGEIDLIAERGGTTVFVEVKARGGRDGETDALLHVNRQRIIRAAEFYLSRHERAADPSRTLRFDVIFVAPWQWPRHVVDAFDATR
jgi:putative endonuclease